MATFGAVAGWAVRRAEHRSVALVRTTSSLAALASVVVGMWWAVVAR
jgi:hypothetical protein